MGNPVQHGRRNLVMLHDYPGHERTGDSIGDSTTTGVLQVVSDVQSDNTRVWRDYNRVRTGRFRTVNLVSKLPRKI